MQYGNPFQSWPQSSRRGITGILAVLALGGLFHAGAQAQSVNLRVQPIENTRKSNTSRSYETSVTQHSSYERGNVRTYDSVNTITHTASRNSRTENIKITLRNMAQEKQDYVVEWLFYARNVQSKSQRIFDQGTKTVALAAGAQTDLEVASQPLTEDVNRSSSNCGTARSATGEIPLGYVVLARAKGRLIAVEASDMDLKRPHLEEMRKAFHSTAPKAR